MKSEIVSTAKAKYKLVTCALTSALVLHSPLLKKPCRSVQDIKPDLTSWDDIIILMIVVHPLEAQLKGMKPSKISE